MTDRAVALENGNNATGASSQSLTPSTKAANAVRYPNACPLAATTWLVIYQFIRASLGDMVHVVGGIRRNLLEIRMCRYYFHSGSQT